MEVENPTLSSDLLLLLLGLLIACSQNQDARFIARALLCGCLLAKKVFTFKFDMII